LVIELARSEFTFLSDSAAAIEMVLGDARLSMERDPVQNFDVLAVDAFSGDSVPVHLLTREAFEIYFRNIRPGGVLAVHISNNNLDLAPVVKAAADSFGKHARIVDTPLDAGKGLSNSTWVLIGDRADIFNTSEFKENAREINLKRPMRPWTDDYSSMYTILKYPLIMTNQSR
jgi:spermidine synthase